MTRLASALSALTVSADTPDGNVTGTLTGRNALTVEFKDCDIDEYTTESEVEEQLSALITSLLRSRDDLT